MTDYIALNNALSGSVPSVANMMASKYATDAQTQLGNRELTLNDAYRNRALDQQGKQYQQQLDFQNRSLSEQGRQFDAQLEETRRTSDRAWQLQKELQDAQIRGMDADTKAKKQQNFKVEMDNLRSQLKPVADQLYAAVSRYRTNQDQNGNWQYDEVAMSKDPQIPAMLDVLGTLYTPSLSNRRHTKGQKVAPKFVPVGESGNMMVGMTTDKGEVPLTANQGRYPEEDKETLVVPTSAVALDMLTRVSQLTGIASQQNVEDILAGSQMLQDDIAGMPVFQNAAYQDGQKARAIVAASNLKDNPVALEAARGNAATPEEQREAAATRQIRVNTESMTEGQQAQDQLNAATANSQIEDLASNKQEERVAKAINTHFVKMQKQDEGLWENFTDFFGEDKPWDSLEEMRLDISLVLANPEHVDKVRKALNLEGKPQSWSKDDYYRVVEHIKKDREGVRDSYWNRLWGLKRTQGEI